MKTLGPTQNYPSPNYFLLPTREPIITSLQVRSRTAQESEAIRRCLKVQGLLVIDVRYHSLDESWL